MDSSSSEEGVMPSHATADTCVWGGGQFHI